MKHLLLLNGLAILAVVSNHAASWVYTAMFYWTERFSSILSPYYGQVGSFVYYVLAIFRHLTIFSVPSFLLVSGYFVAYAARGDQNRLNWKTIRARLKNLLPPYVTWSLIVFIFNALLGSTYTPSQYIEMLLTGGAVGAYFFVPLLAQFYLFSPFITKLTRHRWWILLALAGGLQIGSLVLDYLRRIDPGIYPDIPTWLFARSAIYFPLGVIYGFHHQSIKKWLGKIKRFLLIMLGITALLTLVEQEYLYRNHYLVYGATAGTISSTLFTISAIFTYLSFDNRVIPYSNKLNLIASKSYGIYLSHPLILLIMAKIVYNFTPGLLAYPLLFFLALIAGGVGIPIALMDILRKTPVKSAYRYLFG